MRTLAIAGLLLLLPAARADVLVTALPFTASSPNRYYLAGDVTAPAGSFGFIVGGDSVTLDLSGHTITCAGGPTAMTRAVTLNEHSHFTLTNGRIRNCAFGVDSTVFRARSVNIRIEDVQFVDNYYRAIRLDASSSEILDNRVENTTETAPTSPTPTPTPPPTRPRTALLSPDAPAGSLSTPLISIGIEVHGERNIVRDNTIVDTKGVTESVGISLSDRAVGSIVADNVIRNDPAVPSSYGIWVGGASAPQILDNTIIGFTTGLAGSSTTTGFYRNNTVLNADVPYLTNANWTDGGNNY
jgi:hypothetical protein